MRGGTGVAVRVVARLLDTAARVAVGGDTSEELTAAMVADSKGADTVPVDILVPAELVVVGYTGVLMDGSTAGDITTALVAEGSCMAGLTTLVVPTMVGATLAAITPVNTGGTPLSTVATGTTTAAALVVDTGGGWLLLPIATATPEL